MNAQEALEIITNAIQKDSMTAEQDEVLAITQKALEKQISQKTVLKTDVFFDYYFCPRCGTQLQQKVRCVDIAYLAKSNYCHTCGQALDWEEIKDDKTK